MALSKHTTAGTQGKGDRGSWGSTGRDRRRGGGGARDEQLQPRAPCFSTVPPSLALTITEQTLRSGVFFDNV